ncbi:MAG: DNA translocase FtsK [Spirochaetota bacterium]
MPFLPYILLLVGLFTFFSLYSFVDANGSKNLFGRVGYGYAFGLFYLFGRGAYQIAYLCFIYGLIFFQKRIFDMMQLIIVTFLLVFTTSVFANIFESATPEQLSLKDNGGQIGDYLSSGMGYVFGKHGKFLINSFIMIYAYVRILKYVPHAGLQEKMQDWPYKFWRWANAFREKNMAKLVGKKEVTEDEEFHEDAGQARPRYTVYGSHEKKGTVQTSSNLPWMEIKKVRLGERYETEPESDKSHIPDNQKKYRPSYGSKTVYETFDLSSKREPGEEVENAKDFEIVAEEESFTQESGSFTFPAVPERLAEKVQVSQASVQEAEYRVSEELQEAEEDYFDEEDVDFSFENAPPRPETSTKLTSVSYKEELSQQEEVSGQDEVEEATLVEEAELSEEEKEPMLIQEPTAENQGSLVPDVAISAKSYFVNHKILKVNRDKAKISSKNAKAEKLVAQRIQEIIGEFGYEAHVVTWQKGPIITRYEITIPQGVKLARITSLENELKLYLAVKSIRIIAPIPGKSTIGIEVPNQNREDVFLGDILRETAAIKKSSDLSIVIGKGISGNNVTIALNKLPHLLIAGTTGSGKSVAMNSMISSLIYSKSPKDLRFIMIDPKMVELALYEDIPHLLMPVITDPRHASKALAWAVQEMEARYNCVSELKCRDLKSYNQKVASGIFRSRRKHRKLPYIIIFIDELSDLMMVSGKELEDYITRISQKSRAVGIHLVMATQRPSVDVITGLIKANCPARIAFHVAQKTDSKIILDYNGAETLLGMGDFLYRSPTSSDLQRIQAPYVSEEEIEKIVAETKKFGKPNYVVINLDEVTQAEEAGDEEESLFSEAWNIVRSENKASASYLQRRLRIGYNKAARLMEMMEERGYVGPQVGSKPREILRT